MNVKVRGLPPFSSKTVRNSSEIMSEINRFGNFTKKMTEKNIADGIKQFKSEYDNKKKEIDRLENKVHK